MKKIVALSVFLSMLAVSAIAQKLPNVQGTSLRAPSSIKVDGKASEWNNQFQAYNKATEIYYTLSNDDDKLYLTVQATDLDIVNKIICRGITLTINGTGKMKDQEGVSITFPVLNENAFGRGPRGEPYSGLNAIPVKLDKPASLQADSFMVVLNKDLASKAKDIKVKGVKEITDSLISIYNPEGIKATALFDNKSIFTYELAIPLKYLGLSVSNPKPFVYNIKLPGMNPRLNEDSRDGRLSVRAAYLVQREELKNKTWPSVRPGERFTYWGGEGAPRMYALVAPTDFWAEYTLAK